MLYIISPGRDIIDNCFCLRQWRLSCWDVGPIFAFHAWNDIDNNDDSDKDDDGNGEYADNNDYEKGSDDRYSDNGNDNRDDKDNDANYASGPVG